MFSPSKKAGDLPDLARLTISKEGVLKQLRDLDGSKAQGSDETTPWFLKLAAEDIAPYLTDIFQTSVDSGKIPSVWKEANVAPILEKR